MAHFEYNQNQYEKMVSHLEEALNLAAEDDHQARARACLVLADAFQTAGEFPLARPWYDKARLHAVAEGDNATLSAVFYNVAAMRAANVRLSDAFGIESAQDIHRAAMETSSSYHYDHAIGITALTYLTQMLRGLIMTIDRKFAEALAVFAAIDDQSTPKRLIPLLYADRAWCTLNTGESDRAIELASIAESLVPDLTDFDDLAYTHSRIAQVFDRCSKSGEAKSHRAIAEINLRKHREVQAHLLELLRGMKI
jgi:tetratricopeptide (TPR) repeat protein